MSLLPATQIVSPCDTVVLRIRLSGVMVLLLLLGILFAVALVMGCTAQRGTLRQVGGE